MGMAKSYTPSTVRVTKKDTKPVNCERIAHQKEEFQDDTTTRWPESGHSKEKPMIMWPSLELTLKFKRCTAKERAIRSNED
jgi:hypothetical protein